MQLLQVPLIVIYPGSVPAGMWVGAASSIRDIPATIHALTGIDAEGFPGTPLTEHWREPAEGGAALPQLADARCCHPRLKAHAPVRLSR